MGSVEYLEKMGGVYTLNEFFTNNPKERQNLEQIKGHLKSWKTLGLVSWTEPLTETTPLKWYSILDWKGIKHQVKLEKRAQNNNSAFLENIKPRLKTKNIVIVEVVGGINAYPIFEHFYTSLQDDYVAPMIGVITPFDMKNHLKNMGDKSGAWVTISDITHDNIKQKFNLIKPANSFEIINFIKTLSGKTQKRIVFIGDFFDEMVGLIDKNPLHRMISQMQTISKDQDNQMILFLKKELYSQDLINLFETYADAKIVFEKQENEFSVTMTDYTTNETELLTKGRLESILK